MNDVIEAAEAVTSDERRDATFSYPCNPFPELDEFREKYGVGFDYFIYKGKVIRYHTRESGDWYVSVFYRLELEPSDLYEMFESSCRKIASMLAMKNPELNGSGQVLPTPANMTILHDELKQCQKEIRKLQRLLEVNLPAS